MRLASIETGFQWGFCLVSDLDPIDEVPAWDSPEMVVADAPTVLAVKTRPDVEGTTLATVVVDFDAGDRSPAFTGVLQVPSRQLKVSDALDTQRIVVPVETTELRLRIYVDNSEEPANVTIELLSDG